MRRLLTLALLLAPGAGVRGQAAADAPTLRVDAREEHYRLDEPTLAGVIDRLNAMRLEGEGAPLSQGLTRYRLTPSWRPAAGGGRCRVSRLALDVRVVVTLPEWTAAERASEEERARWTEILGAIRAHEHGHRDLTIEAGQRLVGSLAALEASSCAALRGAFAAALALADADLAEAHAELDRATPERLIGRPGPGLTTG